MRRALAVVAVAGLMVAGTAGMRAGLELVEPGRGVVSIVVERWPCVEDEAYLVGRGEYEGGQWSRYRCVHVDAVRRVGG